MKKSQKKMIKTERVKSKKGLVITGSLLLVVVIAALLLVVWLDQRNAKVVVSLGEYKGLTYSKTTDDDIATELIEKIVASTEFGSKLDELVQETYENTMNYYSTEAAYLGLSLSHYLATYYFEDEATFRESAKESALEVTKQQVVIDAVTDKEGFVLTEDDFQERIGDYMLTYGYTEQEKLFVDYQESEIRESMLRDKTIEFIIKNAHKE